MPEYQVSIDDIIILLPKIQAKGGKIRLKIEDKQQKIVGLGVYNPIKLIGTSYGSVVTFGKTDYWLLPASTMDHIETLKRKAQIILPKDAALLGLYCDVRPGSRVVEGGLGSAALTIVLLSLVGESGNVITYENRPEFAKIGAENIKNAKLLGRWELKQQDISEGITEQALDAVILDIPEPWTVAQTAYSALRVGGAFACYIPTMNQVERSVRTMKDHPFTEIQTFETLYRNIVVSPGGTRPAFDMLGHTGYITVGRKVLTR